MNGMCVRALRDLKGRKERPLLARIIRVSCFLLSCADRDVDRRKFTNSTETFVLHMISACRSCEIELQDLDMRLKISSPK